MNLQMKRIIDKLVFYMAKIVLTMTLFTAFSQCSSFTSYQPELSDSIKEKLYILQDKK